MDTWLDRWMHRQMDKRWIFHTWKKPWGRTGLNRTSHEGRQIWKSCLVATAVHKKYQVA